MKPGRVLKPNPVTSIPAGIDAPTREQREEVEKIQQDIFLLSQRIADAKGEPVPTQSGISIGDSSNSPFVSSLRALAETDRRTRDVKELKIASIESLLARVSEYDRLILSKTVPVDASSGSQRRKSFGSDLASLPTHFRLVDRLIDLHTQSKRVAVIRTTTTTQGGETSLKISGDTMSTKNPSSMKSPDRNIIEGLRLNVSKLSEKLESAESRRVQVEADRDRFRQRADDLEAEKRLQETQLQQTTATLENDLKITKRSLHDTNAVNAEYLKEIEGLKHQLNEQKKLVTTQQQESLTATQHTLEQQQAVNAQLQADIQNMHDQMKQLQQENMSLQCRLEEETAVNVTMLSTLHGRASMLNNNTSITIEMTQSNSTLPSECIEGFLSLDKAVTNKLDSLRSEIKLLLSVKEALEGEMQSSTLQRDMLTQDLHHVTEEHEALKAAYHSLSFETAAASRSSAELDKLKTTVQQQQDTITGLNTSLNMQKVQLKAFEQWPVLVAELEERLRILTQEKTAIEATNSDLLAEIEQYKRLTETLKDKLRTMASKTMGGTDFLDSFEEVMRDEMMTMKSAFEAKLKAARSEADELSRKHAVDLQRIQSQSPFALLQRANLSTVGTSSGSSTKK